MFSRGGNKRTELFTCWSWHQSQTRAVHLGAVAIQTPIAETNHSVQRYRVSRPRDGARGRKKIMLSLIAVGVPYLAFKMTRPSCRRQPINDGLEKDSCGVRYEYPGGCSEMTRQKGWYWWADQKGLFLKVKKISSGSPFWLSGTDMPFWNSWKPHRVTQRVWEADKRASCAWSWWASANKIIWWIWEEIF